MRIAFTGTHRVGKSTLVECVADALPRYATVDEPYRLLEDDGHECSETPSLEDFEAQLERSLAALDDDRSDVLFDRCPVDILAYLLVHEDAAELELDDCIERTREAMQTLDLVVFVPVEDRDRIVVPSHEDRAFRLAVHDQLCRLVIDDALRCEAEVIAVQGDVASRTAQVLAQIAELERRRSRRRR